MKYALLFLITGIVLAQEPAQRHESGAATSEEHEATEGPSAWEAEFVASDIFRSGTYIQPLWRRSAPGD